VTERLTVSILAPIEIYAQLFVARATGTFQDEGLSVELVTLSSVAAVDQLEAGRVHIGACSWSPGVLNAIRRGAALTAIANVFESLPEGSGIYVNPRLVDGAPRSLQGRTIANAGGFTSGGGTLTWGRWLESAGMRLGDVVPLDDVRSDRALAALESGAADAAFLNSPFFRAAVEHGTGTLVPLTLPSLATGYFAGRALHGADDIKRAFLRALVRTTRERLAPGWHGDRETVGIVAAAMGQDVDVVARLGETRFDPAMSMARWEGELALVQDIWFRHGGVLEYRDAVTTDEVIDGSHLASVLAASPRALLEDRSR
jgi:ABC-type nitrate/sulfonate/bicarbonate transport system substrate-binding protein